MVDGSEIRRSPVEVASLSHDLQGFSTIPGGCLGSEPSTVCKAYVRETSPPYQLQKRVFGTSIFGTKNLLVIKSLIGQIRVFFRKRSI